jgi:hypothetical protein
VGEAKKAFFIDEQRKLYPVSLIRNGLLYTLLLVRAISSSFFVTICDRSSSEQGIGRRKQERRKEERERAREKKKKK